MVTPSGGSTRGASILVRSRLTRISRPISMNPRLRGEVLAGRVGVLDRCLERVLPRDRPGSGRRSRRGLTRSRAVVPPPPPRSPRTDRGSEHAARRRRRPPAVRPSTPPTCASPSPETPTSASPGRRSDRTDTPCCGRRRERRGLRRWSQDGSPSAYSCGDDLASRRYRHLPLQRHRGIDAAAPRAR